MIVSTMRLRSVHYIVGGLWLATLLFAFAVGHTINPIADHEAPSPAEGPVEEVPGEVGPKPRPHATARDRAPVRPVMTQAPEADAWVEESRESYEENPTERVRSVLGEMDPLRRMQSFSRLLVNLGPGDLEEMVGAFREMPFERRREFNLLLYRWAQVDGEAAATYLESMGGEGGWGRGWNIGSVMSGWSTQDPEAAIAWARASSDNVDGPHMIGVIYGISQTDLDRATLLALEMPFGRNRGRAVNALLDAALQTGTDDAIEWIQDLPDGDLKYGTMGRLANRVEEVSFRDFADAIMSLPEAELAGAVEPFLRHWTRDDPAAAADWAEQLPTVEMQTDAMADVIRGWARRDATAAGGWLSQFQPSLDMDKVILAYIDRIDRRDPTSAAQWATTLTDPELRDSTVLKFENR